MVPIYNNDSVNVVYIKDNKSNGICNARGNSSQKINIYKHNGWYMMQHYNT